MPGYSLPTLPGDAIDKAISNTIKAIQNGFTFDRDLVSEATFSSTPSPEWEHLYKLVWPHIVDEGDDVECIVHTHDVELRPLTYGEREGKVFEMRDHEHAVKNRAVKMLFVWKESAEGDDPPDWAIRAYERAKKEVARTYGQEWRKGVEESLEAVRDWFDPLTSPDEVHALVRLRWSLKGRLIPYIVHRRQGALADLQHMEDEDYQTVWEGGIEEERRGSNRCLHQLELAIIVAGAVLDLIETWLHGEDSSLLFPTEPRGESEWRWIWWWTHALCQAIKQDAELNGSASQWEHLVDDRWQNQGLPTDDFWWSDVRFTPRAERT